MAGGWLRCWACRRETSVTAGTIFEGTRKPLRTWFLAMWFVTSQKNGVSALGAAARPRPRQLRDLLGLAAQAAAGHGAGRLLRPPCRRDRGYEPHVGGPEEGKRGRQVESKAIVAVAAEQRGRGIGRIRLRRVKDVSAESLLAFLQDAVAPGATIHTDGWRGYAGLPAAGYRHQVTVIGGGSGTSARGHATRPQSRRPAQTVVVGNSPRRHPAPTSRLLPRRIHLPLQSASITGPWPPVSPPRPAGGGHRTGPLPLHHQTRHFRQSRRIGGMKGIPTFSRLQLFGAQALQGFGAAASASRHRRQISPGRSLVVELRDGFGPAGCMRPAGT